jgi:hypothetical protein
MAVKSARRNLFLASSTCAALCRNARLRLSNRPISPRRIIYRVREYACYVCAASLIGTGTFQQPQKRKRSRSVARRRTQQQHIAPENEDASKNSYTFDIGNIDEWMKFFRRRLHELTMMFLRPVVSAWVIRLEPNRLSLYGRYGRRYDKNPPSGRTPPWWPYNIPYREPSRLSKKGKSHLTVTTLVT